MRVKVVGRLKVGNTSSVGRVTFISDGHVTRLDRIKKAKYISICSCSSDQIMSNQFKNLVQFRLQLDSDRPTKQKSAVTQPASLSVLVSERCCPEIARLG